MNDLDIIIDLAYSQIGYTEDPKGSNKTKYGVLYNWNGVPWCAQFIWWLFKLSGLSNLFLNGAKTASCTVIKNFYNERGLWITNGEYKRGDIAIMTFSKTREIQHCGLIIEKINDKKYKTIEGNTSSSILGSQDNGGCVALKIRHIDNILGVCRPLYRIEEEDEDMTDERFAELMDTYLKNQAKDPIPKWAEEELEEAKKLGITDGTRPMQLIPRYQAAIMALRASKAVRKR